MKLKNSNNITSSIEVANVLRQYSKHLCPSFFFLYAVLLIDCKIFIVVALSTFVPNSQENLGIVCSVTFLGKVT